MADRDVRGTRTRAWSLLIQLRIVRNLDISALPAPLPINDGETRSGTVFPRVEGNDVCVSLSSDLQFPDRASIIALALERLAALLVIIPVKATVVVQAVALENLAVLPHFVTIEIDDFGGSVIGFVFCNDQFKPEALGQDP